MRPPTAKEYIEKARDLHEIEGEIEIDHLDETDAEAEQRISRSPESRDAVEGGAYVKAWVWVNREEIQPDYEEAESGRPSRSLP